MEENRSDLCRLKTELERLSNNKLKNSSFIHNMKDRYLTIFKSKTRSNKKWFQKNNYVDEKAVGVIEKDGLQEIIHDGLKPLRYVRCNHIP